MFQAGVVDGGWQLRNGRKTGGRSHASKDLGQECRVQEAWIVEQNSEASVLESSEGGRDIADVKTVDCRDVNTQALVAGFLCGMWFNRASGWPSLDA